MLRGGWDAGGEVGRVGMYVEQRGRWDTSGIEVRVECGSGRG